MAAGARPAASLAVVNGPGVVLDTLAEAA